MRAYMPKNTKIADSFKDEDGFYMGHNATIMAMAVNINPHFPNEPLI